MSTDELPVKMRTRRGLRTSMGSAPRGPAPAPTPSGPVPARARPPASRPR